MKKFPLFLAFALVFVLAVNSFSEKSGNKDSKFNPEPKPTLKSIEVSRERSKDCRWVCEGNKMVLYKGSKIVTFLNAPVPQNTKFTPPDECPYPFQSENRFSQVLKTCGK